MADAHSKAGTKYHYLQQMLTTEMGEQILQDFKEVDWAKIYHWKHLLDFGELTTNLLLVGKEGLVTPAHYDEQHNFFSQLQGRKQVILYSPGDWDKLYPFPVHHACDRQSQVDVFSQGAWPACGGLIPLSSLEDEAAQSVRIFAANGGADAARFPRFGAATAYEALVHPGEMLYIPCYWWHHISSLEETVSLTFWFKCGPPGEVRFPLSCVQKVALRRNVEAQLALLGGGGSAVRDILLAFQRNQKLIDSAALHRTATSKDSDADGSELQGFAGNKGHQVAQVVGQVGRSSVALSNEQQKVALEAMEKLLYHVMKEEEIVPFFQELAAHRFHLPLAPSTK